MNRQKKSFFHWSKSKSKKQQKEETASPQSEQSIQETTNTEKNKNSNSNTHEEEKVLESDSKESFDECDWEVYLIHKRYEEEQLQMANQNQCIHSIYYSNK